MTGELWELVAELGVPAGGRAAVALLVSCHCTGDAAAAGAQGGELQNSIGQAHRPDLSVAS